MQGNELEERTSAFAVRIMNVCEAIPSERLKSGHLKDQLFRAGTAVAANYAEAEEPESREDFIHKMKVAMKESLLRRAAGCASLEPAVTSRQND